MKDNYVYILDGKAYINLTNRCHNACTFCIRNTGDGVAGTPLWIEKEPTADDVLFAFDKIKSELKSDEVVFCGYGEPTESLDALKACAKAFKSMGYKTRLNTNGLGSAVAGRDIAGELCDIDTVSVSLNNSDAQKYLDTTKSAFGTDAFNYVIEFADKCKRAGRNVVFTVVDTIGEKEVEACKRLAAGLGIPLRVRAYISDNYCDGRENR